MCSMRARYPFKTCQFERMTQISRFTIQSKCHARLRNVSNLTLHYKIIQITIRSLKARYPNIKKVASDNHFTTLLFLPLIRHLRRVSISEAQVDIPHGNRVAHHWCANCSNYVASVQAGEASHGPFWNSGQSCHVSSG